jgi:heme exporter protein C
MTLFHRMANPSVILRWLPGLRRVQGLACLVLLPLGLYAALIASPPDYQQGETVRIMYVHVPSAWMALFIYTSMAAAALVSLIWQHRAADVYTEAAAPLGAVFTFICLVTGSLWGQPMWGTWWVWDARLTSVLVLFFLYLGYIALLHAFDDDAAGVARGRFLLIIGFINIPVVKFSVDWWNTLHQPASLTRLAKPAIDPAMLTPLLLMAGAFMALFGFLVLTAMQTQLITARHRRGGAA